MGGKSDNAYELDYIYLPHNSEEFESVHVSLTVGEERIKLKILSEKTVDIADIKDIANGLRNSTFKRMNLRFGKDCDVRITMCGQKFNLTFDENTYAVTGMKEVI